MPATRKHLHVSKPRRRQRSVSLETRASRCGVKNYLNVMRSLHPDEKREYFPVTVDYMREYIGTKKRQGSIKANSLDQYFQHIESYNLALGHGWDSTVFEPMMREVLEELETEEKKNPENEEKKKKKVPNGGEIKRKPKKQQQQQQEGDQPQGGQQQQGAPKQGSQSTPQQGVQQQQQNEQQQQGKQAPLQQQVEHRGQQQGAQQPGGQQPQSHQPQNTEQQQRQQQQQQPQQPQQKQQRQPLRQREAPVTSDPMQLDSAQPASGSSIEFKIDVLDDNAADQTAAAPNKPPLTIGTGMDPQNHLEPLTPRKSPPRSALEILTDYTESGTPSPTFQPQHQLRAVTIRSQNKVYRNNVAVTDTTTFGAVLSYAINKSPPPGKQFVLRSTDGDLEYMPDALVRKVICGPAHADVIVTIEDVRDVDFNHF